MGEKLKRAGEHKSSDETLIAAMEILARDIQSGDGVANAAIQEAGERIAELSQQRDELLLACEKTIAENKQLADGDDCTLIDIVRAVERCNPAPEQKREV